MVDMGKQICAGKSVSEFGWWCIILLWLKIACTLQKEPRRSLRSSRFP